MTDTNVTNDTSKYRYITATERVRQKYAQHEKLLNWSRVGYEKNISGTTDDIGDFNKRATIVFIVCYLISSGALLATFPTKDIDVLFDLFGAGFLSSGAVFGYNAARKKLLPKVRALRAKYYIQYMQEMDDAPKYDAKIREMATAHAKENGYYGRFGGLNIEKYIAESQRVKPLFAVFNRVSDLIQRPDAPQSEYIKLETELRNDVTLDMSVRALLILILNASYQVNTGCADVRTEIKLSGWLVELQRELARLGTKSQKLQQQVQRWNISNKMRAMDYMNKKVK